MFVGNKMNALGSWGGCVPSLQVRPGVDWLELEDEEYVSIFSAT